MKKVLFILLISVGLLTLVGCGKKEEEKRFELFFEGVNVTPGETLKISDIKKKYEKSEVPDCAFGGKGIVYTFEEIEISTNEEGKIYSVYFIDPNIKTKEGIALGDSKDDVIKAYGENASKGENTLLYNKGNVEINFNFSNDRVESIEYSIVLE